MKCPLFLVLASQTLGLLTLTSLAFGAGVISLSVDATQSPQMILHAKELIPVTAGPMDLYYPKWIPGEHGPDGPVPDLTGLHIEAAGKAIPSLRRSTVPNPNITMSRVTLDGSGTETAGVRPNCKLS